MNNVNRPNIYEYHDIVQFLNDWINYLRKTKNDFSLRQFSKNSNIALGYMNMILKRERALTEKAFFKIAPNLNLEKEEQKFLNLLRVVGQSEDSQARLDAVEQMMSFKKFKTANIPENRTFEYLTKWYYVAIYEMYNTTNFDPTPLSIQGKLKKKISISEIEQAIKFLIDHKFILQNPNGNWSQSGTFLDCKEGIFKVSLAQFHKQMLDLAHESITETRREDRYITGQTMAVSRENFEQIKQIIQQAMNSINELNKNSLEKDNVYHVEIAAFPLMEMRQEKKS